MAIQGSSEKISNSAHGVLIVSPEDVVGEEWDRRYKHLVEQAEDMLYLLDEDGRYVLVNDSMAALTGYSKDELIGSTPDLILSADDVESGENRIRRLLRSDSRDHDTWTVTLLTKDGERIPCELRFTLLPPEDGSYQGIVGVARDIRERKRRQQKIDVVTRILRHNIRNKLGLVMGEANLLADRAVGGDLSTEELLDITETIEDASREMVKMSEKVRTIQRRIRSEPDSEESADLVGLGRAVVQQFRAEYPDAEIAFEAPEQAPATVSDSYEVALSELLENGIVHYEGDGDPQVEVRISSTAESVVTTVSDDCPPIPDSEKEVIQEGEETALSHSAGVGLWLVNWVVEAAGGALEFDRTDSGNAVTLVFEAVE